MTCPAPETPEQRKARQFADLRRMSALVMQLAEVTHVQAMEQATRAPDEPRRVDHTASFAALARALRQIVAIEIRLDAPPRTRSSFRPARRADDPRRILLRTAFHDAVAADPDRARRRREIDEVIDERLGADPDRREDIHETIAALCNELNVELDVSRLPDALLDFGEDDRSARHDQAPGPHEPGAAPPEPPH